MKNEIILYRTKALAYRIEVMVERETVWLNKEQIGLLFNRDRTVISRHINNIFKEGELCREEVCAFFALTTSHGAIQGKTQTKQVEYYNLDVIISVGYRVKSKQGTHFRIWANKVLKEYLLKGYSINKRINRIEDDIDAIKTKVDSIDLQINTNLPPKQGIFYDGQIFDAYILISNIIKSAKSSIVLIDNYVDETVFAILSKRNKKVRAKVYTKRITKVLKQDLDKHNAQYAKIEIEKLTTTHDRFMIIDKKIVYHFGASLKDAGKRWFAFSKLDIQAKDILDRL